jgi:hypothetical protein
MLTDSETIKILVGEVFLELAKDNAELYVQGRCEKKAQEIDALEVVARSFFCVWLMKFARNK